VIVLVLAGRRVAAEVSASDPALDRPPGR
jgi:hypothetical protein